MPSRFAFTVTMITALVATTACQAEARLAGFDTKSEEVVAEALRDLATLPALHVTGNIPVFGGRASAQADFTATVLPDGTGLAEFTAVSAGSGELLTLADGSIHVNADTDFWEAEALSPEAAGSLADQWVTLNEDDWPHLGRIFSPRTVGPVMFDEIIDAKALAGDPPAASGSVLEFPVAKGTVTVTAESPHRFIGVTDLRISGLEPQANRRFSGNFSLVPAEESQLDDLRSGLEGALDSMATPMSSTWTELSTSGEDAVCEGLIVCVVGTDFTLDFDTAVFYEGVEVVLYGEVEFEDLGVEDCSTSQTVTAPGEDWISCALEFTNAESGRDYRYSWGLDLNTFGRYEFDNEAAWAQIEADFPAAG